MVKKIDDFTVDKRTLKLNITRGKISKKEYETYLKNLPDLTGQATEMPAYFEEEEEPHVPESNPDDLTFSVA